MIYSYYDKMDFTNEEVDVFNKISFLQINETVDNIKMVKSRELINEGVIGTIFEKIFEFIKMIIEAIGNIIKSIVDLFTGGGSSGSGSSSGSSRSGGSSSSYNQPQNNPPIKRKQANDIIEVAKEEKSEPTIHVSSFNFEYIDYDAIHGHINKMERSLNVTIRKYKDFIYKQSYHEFEEFNKIVDGMRLSRFEPKDEKRKLEEYYEKISEINNNFKNTLNEIDNNKEIISEISYTGFDDKQTTLYIINPSVIKESIESKYTKTARCNFDYIKGKAGTEENIKLICKSCGLDPNTSSNESHMFVFAKDAMTAYKEDLKNFESDVKKVEKRLEDDHKRHTEFATKTVQGQPLKFHGTGLNMPGKNYTEGSREDYIDRLNACSNMILNANINNIKIYKKLIIDRIKQFIDLYAKLLSYEKSGGIIGAIKKELLKLQNN